MVYCPSCGTANDDSADFCMRCGGKITYAEDPDPKVDFQQSSPSSQSQPQTSYSSGPQSYQSAPAQYRVPRQRDEADAWIYCCVVCIPLVGIVLWAIWKEERPNTATTMLQLAIVVIIVNLIIGIGSA